MRESSQPHGGGGYFQQNKTLSACSQKAGGGSGWLWAQLQGGLQHLVPPGCGGEAIAPIPQAWHCPCPTTAG